MNLQSKMGIGAFLLVAFVVASGAGLTFVSERRLLRDEIDRQQLQAVVALMQVAAEAQYQQNDIPLMNYLSTLKKARGFSGACFADLNNTVLLHVDPSRVGSKLSTDLTSVQAPKRCEIIAEGPEKLLPWAAPVVFDGRRLGTVAVFYSVEQIESYVREASNKTLRRILLVAVLCLVVGLLGAMVFARTLVSPIRRLVTGMKRVADGKMEKIALPPRRDELGWMGDQLNDMILKLKELDQMKQDFVAGITHDLKAPLVATDRFLYMILKGMYGPVSLEQRDLLITIQNNTSRLTEMIEQLLATARIEAGHVELQISTFDLLSVLRDMSKIYEPLAHDKKIEFKLELPIEPLNVKADRDRTLQVVQNLISNAFKFTSKGEIVVRASQQNGVARVEVEDTGPGIPESEQTLVFEKFFRGTRTKNTKGTGLGLSIVKGFVVAQGGQLGVSTARSGGSLFWFTLPRG